MRQLLIDSPVLLLFCVAGTGFVLGRVKIGDFSLGVSGILFTGIAVNAWEPALRLPDIVTSFGLALFVYALGLSSGPAFSASLKSKGVRDNLFVGAMLGFGTLLSVAAGKLLSFSPAMTAGLFSGALSSTPSLGSVMQALKDTTDPSRLDTVLAEPIVAYSVSYPVGVIGMIVVAFVMERVLKPNFRKEAKDLRDLGASAEELVAKTIVVQRPEATTTALYDLLHQNHWRVSFGRYRRGEVIELATEQTVLELGDEISCVGTEDDVNHVASQIGQVTFDTFEFDRKEFDLRRVFVSDPHVAGKSLKDLDLPRRFGARITRIRRGDVDLLPMAETRLELGDRVRVVARRERMADVSKFLGDSYKALSEIDIAIFSLGIAMGLLLGRLPIPLPDGSSFHLGNAGGPLIVGLLLGTLRRTGPVVWHMPYSASITLRQLGTILFLAGVGTSSGAEFARAVLGGGALGLTLFGAAVAVTCITGVVTLWVGYRVLKIQFSLLLGLLSGLQTQSALMAFSSEQTENDIPLVGYASVYAAASIIKILAAQLLLGL